MTTPAEALPPSTYRFADLTLDCARRSVTRAGQAIELKALDFDLLRFLVESAPNVVNADVLAEKVWGGDPFHTEMFASLGAPEHALAELRRALAANGPDSPNRYYDVGLWAGHFGDPALALEAMRKAADAGGGRIAYVWMPQLASMRRLPEFKAYLREIGMVAYWQEFGWPPFCRQIDAPDFECN